MTSLEDTILIGGAPTLVLYSGIIRLTTGSWSTVLLWIALGWAALAVGLYLVWWAQFLWERRHERSKPL